MPEFIMPLGDTPTEFRKLDSFAKGYVEAMFFTSTGSADDGELEHATFADLAPETLAIIQNDCAAFETKASALLGRAVDECFYGLDGDDSASEKAGRDFWYTRNGHGTGFWDRGLGEIGEALSEVAHKFGEVDLYRGDDDRLYLS